MGSKGFWRVACAGDRLYLELVEDTAGWQAGAGRGQVWAEMVSRALWVCVKKDGRVSGGTFPFLFFLPGPVLNCLLSHPSAARLLSSLEVS